MYEALLILKEEVFNIKNDMSKQQNNIFLFDYFMIKSILPQRKRDKKNMLWKNKKTENKLRNLCNDVNRDIIAPEVIPWHFTTIHLLQLRAHAPVVQWIEQQPSKLWIQVRSLAGVNITNYNPFIIKKIGTS